MSIKKSIGWTDITRNPIKGLCKGGCWYCYYSGARGIAKRFKHNPKIRLRLPVLFSLPHKPKKIFLCSTHDLFGSWIKKTWRDLIFANIEDNPQHAFQILTKFPQNIDREMPDNVWLGVTVDEPINQIKIGQLKRKEAKIKFVSFEPILGRMNNIYFPEDELHLELLFESLDWIIIGQLTQQGNKYTPQKKWIQEIVNKAKELNIPVFLKNNLKDIWGEPLIQEFPE